MLPFQNHQTDFQMHIKRLYLISNPTKKTWILPPKIHAQLDSYTVAVQAKQPSHVVYSTLPRVHQVQSSGLVAAKKKKKIMFLKPENNLEVDAVRRYLFLGHLTWALETPCLISQGPVSMEEKLPVTEVTVSIVGRKSRPQVCLGLPPKKLFKSSS